MSKTTQYFGVVGERDYIKVKGERVPFWEFLDYQPDGWLTSLRYHRDDVPTDRPQIWDCGAWSYRKQTVQEIINDGISPWTILEEYQKYAKPGGMVVAPDHMLIPGVESLDARRTFNRQSAQVFLDVAREAGFRPMAAIHGMDLDERLEHARWLQDLGYEYLALGGLAARGNSMRLAIDTVRKVREATEGAWLHVLGLSAPDYVEAWDRIGVDSCDGASHFKQAFKGGAFYIQKDGNLIKEKAARVDRSTKEPVEEVIDYTCQCRACRKLRKQDVDTRTYGSNENNMGRAAHNLNMLMRAHRVRRVERTVHLVACVGEKQPVGAEAQNLYQSTWFRYARNYVGMHGEEWAILSAKHGLLMPDTVVEPYDTTLNNMKVAERRGWAEKVHKQISDTYPVPTRFVVLAGRKYRDELIRKLHADGHVCEVPMQGLAIGKQLQWMKQRTQRQPDFFEEETTESEAASR